MNSTTNSTPSATYTQEQQLAMLEAGEYVFKCPPVTPALWSDLDWCAYVTACGGWRPKQKDTHQPGEPK